MREGKDLEERILYEYDFPIHIRLVSVENYPLHFHLDLEIIYVLRGTVTLKNGSSIYSMSAGDIFISNKNEVHGIYQTSADNLIAIIQVQSSAMVLSFPEILMRGGCCIRTLGENRENPSYIYLQKKLMQSIYLWIKKAFGYKQAIIHIMEDLLPFLNNNFNYWIYNKNRELYWEEKSLLEKERLRSIIRYVYAHYDEKLALDTLSYELGLDSYYLSHLVKKDLGISFRELVLFARVELADQLLLGTDMSISEIRKRVAISTMEYFERHFERWYRCSPEEYRRTYQKHTILHAERKLVFADPAEVLKIVETLAEGLAFVLPAITATSESLHISINTETTGRFCFKFRILHEEMRTLDVPSDPEPSNYLWDTVAASIYLLRHSLNRNWEEDPVNYFMDPPGNGPLLQGKRGILTYTGIAKPSYFAYQLLESMVGKLLYSDGSGFATCSDNKETFSVFLSNYEDSVPELCQRENIPWHDAAAALDSFQNEREVLLKIDDLPPGEYLVQKTTMKHKGSLFSYLHKNGLLNAAPAPRQAEFAAYFAAPAMEIMKLSSNGPLEIPIKFEGMSLFALQLKRTQKGK